MAGSQEPQFVAARGTRLVRGGQRYAVSGANYWQAMNLGMAGGPSGDRARVLRDLGDLARRGVNMVRVLAASEGSQFGAQPDRMHPVLMRAPGAYDEGVFAGLDWFLAQLPRFNMTATVTLANYWTWSGGVAQLVSWATGTPIPYPAQWDPVRQVLEGGDYQTFLDYANRFYADASIYDTVQRWYRDHIRAVVTRRNTVTGTLYRDDPSIMAWELMNEPQVIGEGAGSEGAGEAQLFRWIDDSARYVHALAPKHLVTTGAESKNGARWFEAMHRSPHITLASCHFWPLNWGYYNSSDPTDGSVDQAVAKMRGFLDDNAAWARRAGKPTVLFEYGMMRDNWGDWAGLRGYSPHAPVTHRNRFYAAVAAHVAGLAAAGPFAGAAFWAYAGTARPPPAPSAELTWTGDPPHEPPGWNSIYDADEETMAIIHGFGRRIGAAR
ncbi:hypothetical protein H4R18_002975 [Coemansia javaensis]|uniref:mannan endo-1,4-beta-mannosidase n=1 Tax=Coemansia javaensis TaxID=2761396 RepID=A0A9W8HBP4_9FUNG|nr:hypothetical protein H4R18_002975 [Coemansia javaensis]